MHISCPPCRRGRLSLPEEPVLNSPDASTNAYSERWFATFLDTVPNVRTTREVDFIAGALPIDRFREILDVACGSGRHALRLAERGYAVTGWDVDGAVLAKARHAAGLLEAGGDGAGHAEFELRDMRTLGESRRRFDAVVSLWASFGFFDGPANTRVLAGMATALRPGGRLLLDVYDRAFFAHRRGERVRRRNGEILRERTELEGRRLRTELTWPDGHRDTFDWEAFTADELAGRCAAAGLRELRRCADFDADVPADGRAARMQLLLEKPGG